MSSFPCPSTGLPCKSCSLNANGMCVCVCVCHFKCMVLNSQSEVRLQNASVATLGSVTFNFMALVLTKFCMGWKSNLDVKVVCSLSTGCH